MNHKETLPKTFKVEMTPSYEVKGGLWVNVDSVYHICILGKEILDEDTLCGIKKTGYGREWGYRLVMGSIVCSVCAEKGKYTNNLKMNMQNYELVLKKKLSSSDDVINKTKKQQKDNKK